MNTKSILKLVAGVLVLLGSPLTQAANELRVGALVPRTGVAASVGPEMSYGVKYVLEQAGYQVGGRKIVLIEEDESDNPATAVAKARKLVEGDKVDVVLGPLLAHTSAAVSQYLARSGVAHLPFGMADKPSSAHSIYTAGTGIGNAYVAGQYASQDLKRKRAAVLVMDYALGHQMRDGFTAGFKASGGQVTSTQLLPMGTSDVAPYFEGLGEADVLAVLMVNPTDFAFARQYRQAGLKLPVIFISSQPQEEPLLQQMGQDIVGMYGATMYGPEIESPENQKFVAAFKQKYKRRPGIATVHAGYWGAAMVLQAAKQVGADTSRKALSAALLNVKALDTPAGKLAVDQNRMGVHDIYVFQAAKEGNRFV